MKKILTILKHSEIQRMALLFLPMIICFILWHTLRLSYNFGATAWGMPSDDFILNIANFPYAVCLINGVLVYLLSLLYKGKNKLSFS